MAEWLAVRPDLARLHQLEWRYDGPFPAEAIDTIEAAHGMADAALLDRLARDVVRSVAAARRRAAAAELHRLQRHEPAGGLIGYRRSGVARHAAIVPPL